MDKTEIFNKAKAIIKRKKEESLHIEICEQANICPECGDDNLEEKFDDIYFYKVCSNNHKSQLDYSDDD